MKGVECTKDTTPPREYFEVHLGRPLGSFEVLGAPLGSLKVFGTRTGPCGVLAASLQGLMSRLLDFLEVLEALGSLEPRNAFMPFLWVWEDPQVGRQAQEHSANNS